MGAGLCDLENVRDLGVEAAHVALASADSSTHDGVCAWRGCAAVVL